MMALVKYIEFKAKCEIRDQELRENIRVFKSKSFVQLTQLEPSIKEIAFEECLIDTKIEIDENEYYLDCEVESRTYEENSNKPLDIIQQIETPIHTESDNKTKPSQIVRFFELKKIPLNYESDNSSKSSEYDSEIENSRLDAYKCVLCKTVFNNYRNFNQHKKTHTECLDCGKKYLKFADLLKHRVSVHRKKKKFSCNICVEDFPGWQELTEHNRTKHLDCPECSKKCKSYKAMSQHRKNSHYRNENIKCDICGKKFKFSSTLKIHVRRVHAKEVNHKCDICSKQFFEYSTLKAHLKIHSIDREKFSCDFIDCCYVATNLGNLKKHKNMHKAKKPKEEHQPEIIELAVSEPIKPKVKRVVNPIDSPICPYCGKSFTRKAGLDLHIRIHLNDKPYQCEFCLKKFSDSSSLRSHRRTHTDERPYQCDKCEKKFKNSNNLKNHIISAHETEKPFSCHICGKSTKILFNLHKHMRNIHSIERFPKSVI